MVRVFQKSIFQYALPLLLAVIVFPTFFQTAWASPQGLYRTKIAYKTDVAFYTWGNPHYGAFFTGSNGRNQHYLGSGGDGATCGSNHGCIGTWNWHGNAVSTLIIPKSWYTTGFNAQNHLNYRADLWFDA